MNCTCCLGRCVSKVGIQSRELFLEGQRWVDTGQDAKGGYTSIKNIYFVATIGQALC